MGHSFRYEHFMTLVDLASKSCGSQSVLVAYLYGAMSVECNNNNSNAKSKELVLLIFKEAFSIYQVTMSRPCPTKFIWENLSIPWVVWWSILIFLHGSKYEGSITWRASFFGLGNLGVSIFGPSIQATGIDTQGKCKSIDGVSKIIMRISITQSLKCWKWPLRFILKWGIMIRQWIYRKISVWTCLNLKTQRLISD